MDFLTCCSCLYYSSMDLQIVYNYIGQLSHVPTAVFLYISITLNKRVGKHEHLL